MAIKASEQAVINLVINGQQANSSLRELTGAYNALFAQVSRLREADNPEQYRQQIAMLNQVRAARDAERQSVLGQTEANKGFFSDFKKGFSELQEMAEHITIGTLIYKGISWGIEGVRDLFNGAVEAYDEATRTQTQLQQVLKTTGGVAGETKEMLEKYQKTLMDQTGVDDDVIAKGEEMLLTFTNIRGKIYEQALPAIVDMTAALNGGKVTMEGVQATAIQVGKALNDPINGATALKKVGVTLDDQQKQQIKTMQESNNMMGAQAIILKELQKEFGGTAKAVADTDVGAMQKFDTRIGNIKESLGGLITQIKGGEAEAFDPFLKWLEKVSSTNFSETLEKDRIALLADTNQLESSNLSHDARIKLIDKLKEQYPEYLEKIDSERIKNADLLPVLNKINEALVLRIAYSKKGEALQEAMSNEADAMLKADKAAQDLATSMALVKERAGNAGLKIIVPQNLTDLQQAQYIVDQLNKHKADGLMISPHEAQDLSLAVLHLKEMRSYQKDAQDERTKFMNEQQRFAKQYGIDSDGDDAAQQKYKKEHPVKQPTSGPSEAEQKAAAAAKEKQARELLEYQNQLREVKTQIDELIGSATKGTILGLDQQLKIIDDKYQNLIAKLQNLNKNKNATADDKAANNKQIKELQIDDTAAKLIAADDAYYKDDLKRLKDFTQDKQNALDDQYADGLLGETSYNSKKEKLQQDALDDEYYLAVYYGQNTVDIEKKLADLEIKNKKRVHDETLKNLKIEKEAEKDFLQAKQAIEQAKSEAITSGFDVVNQIFGKNKALMLAELAIQDVVAIGKIKAQEGIEIAGYFAKYAALPGGEFIAAGLAAAAETRADLSIAQIVLSSIATGIGDLKGGAKAAKGGVFSGPSHDQGGLNVVDPRTGQTIVNVEGDEPWMVLSKETRKNNGSLINQLLFNSMYRNGAAVDVAGVNQGIKMARGGHVNTASGDQPAFSNSAATQPVTPNSIGNSAGSNDLAETNRLLGALHDRFDDWSKKPWDFNNRAFEQYQAKVKANRNAANG